ncbi:MAG: TetR/AcrR family transcriptional regulator [Microthrixaceae bacterium]
MSRRTKDERKDDYLDIGAALVAESALGGSDAGLALAHVKIADVAERAGVTKGALYHIWDSQEAYWRDLLQHLMDGNRLFGADQVDDISHRLGAASASRPTLRDYANALFDSMSQDPAFFARISLFSYLHDDAVRANLDREFIATIDRVAPALDAALAEMQRRIRDGSTMMDFAVAVAALLEGLCLQYRISPERTPDVSLGGDARWSLFAASAEALLYAYTVPLAADAAEAPSAGEVRIDLTDSSQRSARASNGER